MKIRNTITKLITMTMAVAAMAALSFALTPARAASQVGPGDGSVRFVSYACIGIVPRQKLRLNVANTANSIGDTAQWTFTVSNSGGVPLYESERIRVPAGEIRSRDISYSGLEVAGEPETRRVQMLVKLVVELPTGIDPSRAIDSLELIDEETDGTVAVIRVRRFAESIEPTS